MNAINGPDATPSTVDDDDPNDPFFVKAQHDPTVTLIRRESGPQIFAAWSDRSLFDVDPNQSNDFSIGYGAGDPSLNWAFHDLAREVDGSAGDLPVPEGGGPATWMSSQVTPKAAVIPPGGTVTGVYMVGMDHGSSVGQGQRIFVASSPDGQHDWYCRSVFFEPYDPGFAGTALHSPYLTVWKDDPNAPVSMLVTWSRVPDPRVEFGNERVMFSISTNGGQTFSAPVRMSDPDVGEDIAGFARLSASAWAAPPPGTSGGALYVVWYQAEGGDDPVPTPPDAIKWRRYDVNTQTWDPPIGTNAKIVAEIVSVEVGWWIDAFIAPLNFLIFDQASVVIDYSPGRRGTVYVAFASLVQNHAPRYDPDIFVATKPNAETEFRAAVKVNNDPPIPYGDPNDLRYMPTIQLMPWIALTDQGHVGVAWYDRRDHTDDDGDGQDFNRKQNLYFSYSISGAQFFSENFRISETESDSGPGDHPDVSLGAYSAIGGVNSSFFPVWVDLRDWIWEFNQPNRLGDIYSTEIRICEGNPPDYDNDCDVDTADFAIFAQCFGMSTPECLAWDFTFSGVVDTGDFSIFQQAFTGAIDPPACAWGCPGGGSAMGEGDAAASLEDLLENEDVAALYNELEAYCRANGIPFP